MVKRKNMFWRAALVLCMLALSAIGICATASDKVILRRVVGSDGLATGTIVYFCDFEEGEDLYADTALYPYGAFLARSSGYTRDAHISGERSYEFVLSRGGAGVPLFDVTPHEIAFDTGNTYTFKWKMRTLNITELSIDATAMCSDARFTLNPVSGKVTDSQGIPTSNIAFVGRDGYNELTFSVTCTQTITVYTPLLVRAAAVGTVTEKSVIIDDFTVIENGESIETISSFTVNSDSTENSGFLQAVDGNVSESAFVRPTEDGNYVIEGSHSACIKVSSSASDGYTGQFMNINEGKTASLFTVGHSYRFSFKVYTENIKELLFRSNQLGISNDDGWHQRIKFETETGNVLEVLGASDSVYRKEEGYSLAEFTMSMESDGGWTPLLFEAHVTDISEEGVLILDDFTVTDITSGREIIREDFENILSLRDDTVLYNFDGASFALMNAGDKAYAVTALAGDLPVLRSASEIAEFAAATEYRFSLTYACADSVTFTLGDVSFTVDSQGNAEGIGMYSCVKTDGYMQLQFAVRPSNSASFEVYVPAGAGLLLKSACVYKFSYSVSSLLTYGEPVKSTYYEAGESVCVIRPSDTGIFGDASYLSVVRLTGNASEIKIGDEIVSLTHSETTEAYKAEVRDGSVLLQVKVSGDKGVAITAARACNLEIAEQFVFMTDDFIEADEFRGTEVYRHDFETDEGLEFGFSKYARTGTTSELTLSADKVINGESSLYGGFDYRKENITWAKMFGIPKSEFTIKSNTSYTVTFRYNVIEDSFLQLGEFYFIFNSKSGKEDRYFGFGSTSATAFRQGVTSYRFTHYEGYTRATVALQTGSGEYSDCLFGIHLGGYAVIDDFAIYENAVLPTPEAGPVRTVPRDEEEVFALDFADGKTYALNNGAYFTSALSDGVVSIRNDGGDWAEGLRVNYSFAPDILYKVTIEYKAPFDSDCYVLIKGDNVPANKHLYSFFGDTCGKAFGKDGILYKNGIYDFTVSKGEATNTATFFCRPQASGMQLILGVYGNGALHVTNVTVSQCA